MFPEVFSRKTDINCILEKNNIPFVGFSQRALMDKAPVMSLGLAALIMHCALCILHLVLRHTPFPLHLKSIQKFFDRHLAATGNFNVFQGNQSVLHVHFQKTFMVG